MLVIKRRTKERIAAFVDGRFVGWILPASTRTDGAGIGFEGFSHDFRFVIEERLTEAEKCLTRPNPAA